MPFTSTRPMPGAAHHRGSAAVAASLLAAAVVLAPAGNARAASNGAAIQPQMGWSSWSLLRMNINQAAIQAQAQAIHTSGLQGLGYTYVNVDDGWYLNPVTTVDADGLWAVDQHKFPSGVRALADSVHSLGLKLGWYLTPGIPVAAYNQNTPIQGSAFHARDIVSDTVNHEANYNFGNSMYYIDWAKNPAAAQAYLDSWAKQLANWGVDYVKLDGVGNWDIADVTGWYQALLHSGRTIHLELSNSLAIVDANLWRHNANGWRIDGDIECYCTTVSDWNHVHSRFNDAPHWTQYAGPGAWNDLDSIEPASGLTSDERRTQVTLWAINAAPLLLGVDTTTLTSDDLAIIANPEVIAIDQAGSPGHPLAQGLQQTWIAYDADGSFSVAFFNLDAQVANVAVQWSQLGFTGSALVHDAWSRADLGSFDVGYSAALAPHASRLLKVTPPAGSVQSTMLVSPATSRCLTAPSVAGAQLTISDCSFPRGDNQVFTYAADKTLRVQGLCLDVKGRSVAQGAEVDTYPCNGQDNQHWTRNADGSFIGVQSGMCMDVSGGLTTSGNGTPVIIWPCHGGDNQKWLRR
jgi:alpha-galactosidase